MKKAFLYFILYRLLDIESILWTLTDIIRAKREAVAARLYKLIKQNK